MEWIDGRIRPENGEEATLLKMIASVGLYPTKPIIQIEQCGEVYLPLSEHATQLVGRGVVTILDNNRSYHGITPEKACELKEELYGEPPLDYFPRSWTAEAA